MKKPEPIQKVGGEAIRKFREGMTLLEKSSDHALHHSCEMKVKKN